MFITLAFTTYQWLVCQGSHVIFLTYNKKQMLFTDVELQQNQMGQRLNPSSKNTSPKQTL